MKCQSMQTMVMLLMAMGLSACVQSAEPELPAIGLTNPASVFCQEQGGQSLSRQDEYGNEYGVCVFADGRELDEWAYFREQAQTR